jgi:hypothetical protein
LAPTVERSPVPTTTPLPPPSATPEPTATPAPSATPEPPSPTPNTFNEPGGGALVFEDLFNSAGIWGVEDTEAHTIAVAGGALTITVKQADRWALTLAGRQARDFYAEVTASATNCGGDDSYGLLFRLVDAANFYYFGLGCGGRYRLRGYVGGEWRELVEWTQADTVASAAAEDGSRKLAVRAVDDRLYFFANDIYLGEASDGALGVGTFGLFAHSTPLAGLAVRFDDLRVYAAAAPAP